MKRPVSNEKLDKRTIAILKQRNEFSTFNIWKKSSKHLCKNEGKKNVGVTLLILSCKAFQNFNFKT